MNVNEPIDTNAWPEPENDIATCSSVSASECLEPSRVAIFTLSWLTVES